MTPEVVVFDLGKVLVDFDYEIAATAFASSCKLPAVEIRHLVEQSPLLVQFETGRLTSEEFHRAVCSATGYDGGFDEFCRQFSDIFTPIEEMVNLHATLRDCGVPTYIFSNTNELAVRHIDGRFPFYGKFTGYILSYEHGAMKPDAKLYEVVERMTGKSGKFIVYLDDREENVAAGAARGWRAIQHVEPAASRKALQQLGLPV